MRNSLKDLTVAQLKKAAAIKEQIEKLEKDLAGLLGIPEALTIGGTVRRHRKMSAAGRARLSSVAKAQWTKMRTAKKP